MKGHRNRVWDHVCTRLSFSSICQFQHRPLFYTLSHRSWLTQVSVLKNRRVDRKLKCCFELWSSPSTRLWKKNRRWSHGSIQIFFKPTVIPHTHTHVLKGILLIQCTMCTTFYRTTKTSRNMGVICSNSHKYTEVFVSYKLLGNLINVIYGTFLSNCQCST